MKPAPLFASILALLFVSCAPLQPAPDRSASPASPPADYAYGAPEQARGLWDRAVAWVCESAPMYLVRGRFKTAEDLASHDGWCVKARGPAPQLQPAVVADRIAAPPERRIALVIGTGRYDHLPDLANPANDARAIGAAFRRLGFEVEEAIDLGRIATRQALRSFADRLDSGAEVAAFYYAGHGLQVDGRNHILPADARITRAIDLPFEAIDLSRILDIMESRPRTSLVFLDACRDNPIGLTGGRSHVGRGLARVDAGAGTLIAYATQPNAVAADDDGSGGMHSPFTAALLMHLEEPGLEVRRLLTRVRLSVITMTNGRQVPWDHSSLTRDFYFRPAAGA